MELQIPYYSFFKEVKIKKINFELKLVKFFSAYRIYLSISI